MQPSPRWLLVPIAAVAAWIAAILSVVAFDKIYWTFEYPCPRYELTDAGACLNGSSATFEWFETYQLVLMSIGAGLAAIYIIVACTVAAPSHKVRTARTTFAVGAVVAIAISIAMKELAPSLTAIMAGASATFIMSRKHAPASVA